MRISGVVVIAMLASTPSVLADRSVPAPVDVAASARAEGLLDGLSAHYSPMPAYSAEYDLVVTRFGPKSTLPFTEHGTVDRYFDNYRWAWSTYRVTFANKILWRMDDDQHTYSKTLPSALLDGVLAFSDPSTIRDHYIVTSPSDLQLVLRPREQGTSVERIVIQLDSSAPGRVTDVCVFDLTGASHDFHFTKDASDITRAATANFSLADVLATYHDATRPLPLPTTTPSDR